MSAEVFMDRLTGQTDRTAALAYDEQRQAAQEAHLGAMLEPYRLLIEDYRAKHRSAAEELLAADVRLVTDSHSWLELRSWRVGVTERRTANGESEVVPCAMQLVVKGNRAQPEDGRAALLRYRQNSFRTPPKKPQCAFIDLS